MHLNTNKLLVLNTELKILFLATSNIRFLRPRVAWSLHEDDYRRNTQNEQKQPEEKFVNDNSY